MEKLIEQNLLENTIKNKEDLKEFVRKIQSQIKLYEKKLYDKDLVSEENLNKIKLWRSKLYEIINKHSELPNEEEENEEDKKGLDTLGFLYKQIDLAVRNQNILENSTLKLLGLNYTSAELEELILQTGKKFENNKNLENYENRKLMFALFLFLAVCVGILIDKLKRR